MPLPQFLLLHLSYMKSWCLAQRDSFTKCNVSGLLQTQT